MLSIVKERILPNNKKNEQPVEIIWQNTHNKK